MQTIKPSQSQWPRKRVKSLSCRKRDLVVRIANWMSDAEEPAYDVEVYIGGVYDWEESKTFSLREHGTRERCKQLAIAFANAQTAKLL